MNGYCDEAEEDSESSEIIYIHMCKKVFSTPEFENEHEINRQTTI